MPDFGMRLLKSATLLSGIDLLTASLSTVLLLVFFIVCVYSNSRNDFPRVAQRYGTIAAHTRRRASVLVVFVMFCVHVYSFAGLIRRTPSLTFSDTAITDRLIPLFSSSELTVCGYPGLLDRKNCSDMCPGGSRTLDFLRARRAPYPLGQARKTLIYCSLRNLITW